MWARIANPRYRGNEAIEAAKKNGDAEVTIVNGVKKYTVPGDLYISNQNSKIRKLKLSKEVKFDLIFNDNLKDKTQLNTIENFKKDYSDRIYLLSIKNYEIVKIKEIFTP